MSRNFETTCCFYIIIIAFHTNNLNQLTKANDHYTKAFFYSLSEQNRVSQYLSTEVSRGISIYFNLHFFEPSIKPSIKIIYIQANVFTICFHYSSLNSVTDALFTSPCLHFRHFNHESHLRYLHVANIHSNLSYHLFS